MKKMAIFAIAVLASAALLSGIVNAGSSVQLTTNKSEYETGETVLITVYNDCRSTITFEGYWIEDAAYQAVYTPSGVDFPVILAPGETFRGEWYQNTDSGDMAVPGAYTVATATESVKVTILAPQVPVLEAATDSQAYIIGQEVQVTVTNVGSAPAINAGFWVENDRSEFVYAPNTILFPVPTAPGESVTYVWDQKDQAGCQVPMGQYYVCTPDSRTEIGIFMGPSVNVQADREVYEADQPVIITLTNTGDMPIMVSNTYTITDQTGRVVYTPNVLAFMRPLNPGTSIEFVWEQVDNEGRQVPDGEYRAVTDQGSVSFVIDAPNEPLQAEHPSQSFGNAETGLEFIPKHAGPNHRI